jgi:hypothetical protein
MEMNSLVVYTVFVFAQLIASHWQVVVDILLNEHCQHFRVHSLKQSWKIFLRRECIILNTVLASAHTQTTYY